MLGVLKSQINGKLSEKNHPFVCVQVSTVSLRSKAELLSSFVSASLGLTEAASSAAASATKSSISFGKYRSAISRLRTESRTTGGVTLLHWVHRCQCRLCSSSLELLTRAQAAA